MRGRRVRDPLSVYNERVKLFATFVNALALGLLGFAVLGPATADIAGLDGATAVWSVVGLALHVTAHYVLSLIRRESDDDRL